MNIMIFYGLTDPKRWESLHYRGFTITPGRNPLDEWSARCRYLYPTTNTHKRQTSIYLAGFEPATPASERLQTYTFDRVVTVSATSHDTNHKSFNTNIGHTNSVATCPCILKQEGASTTYVRSYILNYWMLNTQNNILQQYNYLSLPSRNHLTRVLISTYPTQ
jgi:hypothetical protein